MEYQNSRDQHCYRQDIYDGQSHATQIPAQYNSSSLMSAAQFGTPQSLQQSTPRTIAQSPLHASYLAVTEPFVSSAFQNGFQYPGMTSLGPAYNGYGVDQQSSVSPSFGSHGLMYGYQHAEQASKQYAPENMGSMSISSHYGMPQSPQVYPSTTSPYNNLPRSTTESMYEAMAIDHQAYQAQEVATSNYYQNYSPQEQTRPQIPSQETNTNLGKSFEQYQTKTKEIFTLVKDNQLKPTASLLLQTSRFLIGNVEALGLDRDDKSQYEYRLKLWDVFNQCWLAVLHKQLKTTQSMLRTGQELQATQSILDADTLEALGQEIVKLCDGIEKTGLVDYQMGVAEERIIELLLKCLDVMGPKYPSKTRASVSSGSSRSRS